MSASPSLVELPVRVSRSTGQGGVMSATAAVASEDIQWLYV